MWQSTKIAAAADAFEVNIAPHNFYGHLATMMNVHFAAATTNLRIMEVDVDRLPWDHELFTAAPQFENGHIVVPDTPGWGTEPNEEAIRAHPPKTGAGLMSYRQS
ncbi:MAG: enolase C-terminal domain-like protein [Stellaceae bacterium]